MRGLKKGKETEFKLAAQLLDVVVLTLGAESEELYPEFAPVLSVTIKDATASSVVRAAVCIIPHLSIYHRGNQCSLTCLV